MAQAIYCDGPGDSHPAAYLLQKLDGSSVVAFCEEHWLDFASFTAQQVAEAEAAADMAAAQAEADETDAEALRRLEGAAMPPSVAADEGGGETGHVGPIEGVAGIQGGEAEGSDDMTDPDAVPDDARSMIDAADTADDERPETVPRGRAAGRHR